MTTRSFFIAIAASCALGACTAGPAVHAQEGTEEVFENIAQIDVAGGRPTFIDESVGVGIFEEGSVNRGLPLARAGTALAADPRQGNLPSALLDECGQIYIDRATKLVRYILRNTPFTLAEGYSLAVQMEGHADDYIAACGGPTASISCGASGWEETCANGSVKTCGISCFCDNSVSCAFMDFLPECDPGFDGVEGECSWFNENCC